MMLNLIFFIFFYRIFVSFEFVEATNGIKVNPFGFLIFCYFSDFIFVIFWTAECEDIIK